MTLSSENHDVCVTVTLVIVIVTMMNRYVTLQSLGDGTYGNVVLGQRVDTGEKVRRKILG